MTIRMTRAQFNSMVPLNEDVDIQIQEQCQHEIDEVLNILYGYVHVSDMPEEVRKQLLQGLAHITAHIKSELKELTTDVEGRLN